MEKLGNKGSIERQEVRHILEHQMRGVTGKHLFAGYKIDWMSIGRTGWEKFKNYCRSWVDSGFEKAVRQEFCEYMKADLKKTTPQGVEPKTQLENASSAIENIMANPNLAMEEKMELVQSAVGGPESCESIIKAQIDVNSLDDVSKAAYNHLVKSSEYFEKEKTALMNAMEKITMRAKGGTLDKKVEGQLNTIRQEFKNKDIREPETQKEYSEKIIKVMVNVCNGNVAYLKKLEENVMEMLQYESGITISEEDKNEVLNFVKIPRMKSEALQNMPIFIDSLDMPGVVAIAVVSEEDKFKEIREKYETAYARATTEADLKSLQKEYRREIVEEMVRWCYDTKSRTRLDENLNKLFSENSPVTIPIEEKENLLAIVRGPSRKDKAINFIDNGIAARIGLWDKEKIELSTLKKEYEKIEISSWAELNPLMVKYLKELIPIIAQNGQDSDILADANSMMNLIESHELGFSESQKAEIISELFTQFKNIGGMQEQMEFVMKKGIPESEKMEAILILAGANPEFQKIAPPKRSFRSYFQIAKDFFYRMQIGGLNRMRSTLIVAEKGFTSESLFEVDAMKHLTFFQAISENKALAKDLEKIEKRYNRDVRSVAEFREQRMSYGKDIIKTVVQAWPSLNIKGIFGETLPLKEMREALEDNIRKLAVSSVPPLTEEELKDLLQVADEELKKQIG